MATIDTFQRPASYVGAAAVTPNDGTDLTVSPCRALYIGTAGTLRVTVNGSTVNFGAVVAGVFPVAVTRVHATGTGASNIVALY
jgi:hypothetical protein